MAMTVSLCIGMMALVTMTTVTGCSSTPEPEPGAAVDARLAELVRDGTSAPLGEVVERHWDRAAFFHEGVTAERVNSVVASEAISDRWTASPALLVVVEGDDVRVVRLRTPALANDATGRAFARDATVSGSTATGMLTVR
ncbi:hypothetical protein ACFY2Y_04685 [Janibacter hoylei]|uniref:hypothetical protein n=1 Tax=Janibacter hoylei TaxID=364298 RepID=UPI0036CC1782